MIKTNDRKIELIRWRFLIDQKLHGLDAGWHTPEFDHSCWAEVETCRAWETYEEAMRDFEDRGWYFTTFRVSTDPSLRQTLHFDGVGGTAQVYINGVYAGGTDSRYLPFDLDISSLVRRGEENAVAVLVDNRFTEVEHLPGANKIDWVLWGGLTRRVFVIEHPACYISHLSVRADMDGSCRVQAEILNQGNTAVSGTLKLHTDGLPEADAEAEFTCYAGANTVFTLHTKAENVKLWSPEHPNLYTIHADLIADGETLHKVHDRIGYRTIEVKETHFYLNGEELILKGANRYDEYVPYGNCPPVDLIREDLAEMKRFGMNIVRTHYPQDPVHYEIADELGLIYMIEVVLNWWFPPEDKTLADYPNLKDEAIRCLDDTQYWFGNHACWLIWSVGNECWFSNTACKQMFRMLAARMRSLDTGRLITNVTCRPPIDSEELDYCDFLSMNYYSGNLVDTAEEYEESCKPLQDKMENAMNLYPDIPHVMTEFGTCTVYGLHGSGKDGRFTEELGAVYLKKACEIFSRNPNMRGLIVWSWADYYHHRRDFRLAANTQHIHGGYGPFGIVSNDRKRKTAPYETMREIFKRFNGKDPL